MEHTGVQVRIRDQTHSEGVGGGGGGGGWGSCGSRCVSVCAGCGVLSKGCEGLEAKAASQSALVRRRVIVVVVRIVNCVRF